MVNNIMVSLKKIKDMVMEFLHGKMDVFTMGSGKWASSMAEEYLDIQTEVN
jgi:hypothetical protein